MDAEYIPSSKECALDQRTHQLQQELSDNQLPPKIPECPHITLPGQEKKKEKPPNLNFELLALAHRIKSSSPVTSHQIHTAADQAVQTCLQAPPVEEAAAASPYPECFPPQSPPAWLLL